ncbi:MAG: hypothetical protein K0S65_4623 [Labilithrix sp.]|nr:hypothetical protein [Labilithrix sp.]
MNYPPNAPPPGGYGGPPGGGYGGPPPGGYGPPPGGGYGPPPPGMPGMGAPMGAAMAPHAPYGIDPITGMPFSDKSKMVAGLLNILLPLVGICGVGRFYTGHIGLGVAQLLLGWLTCGIWPLVDGIMMLMGKITDSQGRPLRD